MSRKIARDNAPRHYIQDHFWRNAILILAFFFFWVMTGIGTYNVLDDLIPAITTTDEYGVEEEDKASIFLLGVVPVLAGFLFWTEGIRRWGKEEEAQTVWAEDEDLLDNDDVELD